MTVYGQISAPMFLIPAYGRQYKTKQQALDAWKDGKDFKIVDGPYTSIRDINELHGMADRVLVQYDNGIFEV